MALKFSSDLLPGIKDGKITMQFGLWKRPRVVAGRVYVVKGLGVVRVTAVEKIDLSRLTPWEAEAAGAKDVTELRSWLKLDDPSTETPVGSGYRVRFRYVGPETKDGTDDDGEAKGDVKAGGKAPPEAVPPSPVPPKAVPADLMAWIEKRDWRMLHLKTLSSGVWRNADDISSELDVDSATTRRRMGDLRKRGLVSSHRHHGYRITPEGQGAIGGLVDQTEGGATSIAMGWLKSKGDRPEIIETLKDGKWHNAAEIGEVLGLSVVSVQRRVAALRDRGIIDSHRRRGYRLTDLGFEALEMTRGDVAPEAVSVDAGDAPPTVDAVQDVVAPADTVVPPETEVVPKAVDVPPEAEPIPSSLLEWLDARSYRKEIILAIPSDEYRSSGELSEVLATSVTALHGRLKTLKERGLVEAIPRRGYRATELGARVSDLLSAMANRTRTEPEGASAFLSAESAGWSDVSPPVGEVKAEVRRVAPARIRARWGAGETCGFCRAGTHSPPVEGWVSAMITTLESPLDENSKVKAIPCKRGIMEDASWFLVVDRNPLAEGHCKLVCKEHVWDLVELGEWAIRDQTLAMVRDTLARDLTLAVEVIMAMDPRIVDVVVLSGSEHGSHLHFDLIPRYRMDLPGLRPLASARAFYDDLSLVRKRRLWETRREHLEDVGDRLRKAARTIISSKGPAGLVVSEP
jgi:Mn-dependent DtxR family transcriptional regulator/diadenosine tetraphosphate (Ap4A) HIT family hydrolase